MSEHKWNQYRDIYILPFCLQCPPLTFESLRQRRPLLSCLVPAPTPVLGTAPQIGMPSTYDVLGLIIGVISLLTFAKHIKRLVHGVLPPARVKAVENTISEIRTLVDRLESQGNLAEGASQAWTEYRSRLAE